MTIEELCFNTQKTAERATGLEFRTRLTEFRSESLKNAVSDFEKVEHRLEFVAQIHGMKFINDSRSVNVNSAWYALQNIDGPIIWLVGGKDLENDYSKLYKLVFQKVKAIICIGDNNANIINSFVGKVRKIYETNSMNVAVNAAYRLGTNGDTILLSPACECSDLNLNFQERGLLFKQCVKSL